MDSYQERFQQKSFENERNKKKFDLLCQWIKLKNNNISLREFFVDRDIRSIAIYGMGEIGQLLYEELSKWNEQLIHYAIDRSEVSCIEKLPIYSLRKGLPKVDAVIITPVLITDQLEDEIYEVIGGCNTFVFEELLYEVSRKHKISSRLWRSLY